MTELMWKVRSLVWKWREDLLFWFVWKLPRRIIEIAVVRAWANATTGPFSHEWPPGLTCDEVLRRWMKCEGGDPHPSTVSY